MEVKNTTGSKAAGLRWLREQHCLVPEFHAIDYKSIVRASEDSDRYWLTYLAQHQIDANARWAVRSSADVEDGIEQSYAGQFKSLLNIEYSKLPAAIAEVAEAFTKISSQYGTDDSFGYGIVLQKMIQPDFAGVLFSWDVLSADPSYCTVSVAKGLADALVSGEEDGVVLKIYEDGRIIWPEHDSVVDAESLKSYEFAFLDFAQKAKELEHLKGHPVDVEFAVANGELYWLQIRPITTLPRGQLWIWDNANISENYPGATMPISTSFIKRAYSGAYKSMFRALGSSEKVISDRRQYFDNIVGDIDGALYYNATVWQSLLYILPFGKKLAFKYPDLLSMPPTYFKPEGLKRPMALRVKFVFNLLVMIVFNKSKRDNYINLCNELLSKTEDINLASFSTEELRQEYMDMEQKAIDNWHVPVINGFLTIVFFNLLERQLKGSKLLEEHPSFVNQVLMGGGKSISFLLVESLESIVTNIQQNDKLIKLFEQEDNEQIISTLKTKYSAVYQQIRQHITLYGDRIESGELKMENRTFKENPILFIQHLKGIIPNPIVAMPNEKEEQSQNLIRQYYTNNPIKMWLLKFVVKRTGMHFYHRENFRFWRARIFGILRKFFREFDHRLIKESLIESADDSQYLEHSELLNSGLESNYKQLISERKKAYAAFQNPGSVSRYHQIGTKFYPHYDSEFVASDGLNGKGASGGIVEAEVLIINKDNLKVDTAGKILVAKNFEPGWVHLFVKAAGVVSERGNVLSHTSIICRELQVPAVVSVKGVMGKIKNGDRIKINGFNGEIAQLDDE